MLVRAHAHVCVCVSVCLFVCTQWIKHEWLNEIPIYNFKKFYFFKLSEKVYWKQSLQIFILWTDNIRA